MTFHIIIQILFLVSFIAYIISSQRLIKAQDELIGIDRNLIEAYHKLTNAQNEGIMLRDKHIKYLTYQNRLLKEEINELHTRTD